MSLFRKKYHYSIPERLTAAEARERRLTALLEREQRFLQVPNFPEGIQAARSRVENERAKSRITKDIINAPDKTGHKAALIAAALNSFKERDFADEAKRNQYRALRRAQLQSGQNVQPSGSDKRRYDPTGKDYASTIYGTAARLAGVGTKLVTGWTPMFLNPAKVMPCIQRQVQREVMFATGKGGRGYHTRKRRTWSSGVPC